MKILYVGGTGNNDDKDDYFCDWRCYVERELKIRNNILTGARIAPLSDIEPHYFTFDDLFEEYNNDDVTYLLATVDLLQSFPRLAQTMLENVTGVHLPIPEFPNLEFIDLNKVARINDLASFYPGVGASIIKMWKDARWGFGMIAQLFEDPRLRRALRIRFANLTSETRFDIIIAHSLGSLITYYSMMYEGGDGNRGNGSETEEEARELTEKIQKNVRGSSYVTLGSQIGYSVVREKLWKRCSIRLAMPPVDRWYFLYNSNDLMTEKVTVYGGSEGRFKVVETARHNGHAPVRPQRDCPWGQERVGERDGRPLLRHEAWQGSCYLDDERTKREVWADIIGRKLGVYARS